MKSDFLTKLNSSKTFSSYLKEIDNLDEQNNVLYFSPLSGSSKSLFIDCLSSKKDQIVLLLPTRHLVNELTVELTILGLENDLVSIDKIDYETIHEKLTSINKSKKSIIISTYDLLKINLPSKSEVEKSTTKLEVGSDITYDELIEYLASINYQNEKLVIEKGCFSVRGSIIDFWSYSEEHPCRIEFDGDFLESLRFFDPESQRSSNRIDSVTVASNIDSTDISFTSTIFDYLKNPFVLASSVELNNAISNTIKPSINSIGTDDLDDELKKELLDNETSEPVIEEVVETDITISVEQLLNEKAIWLLEDPIQSSTTRYNINISSAPSINSNYKLLFKTLEDFATKGFQIYLTVENEIQSNRISELLYEFNDTLKELLDSGILKVEVLAIKEGFILNSEKTLVLTDYEVFNKPYRTKISKKQKTKRSRVKEFSTLKVGDYIVHENFGIGKYVGLETIKIGMIEQETIKILYAEGGLVYLNLNYLSLIKRYSSGDKAPPRLSILGSGVWKNSKKKVKSKIKDAARDLIKLYAKRKSAKGITFSADTVWQHELEASFLYEPTPDQAKVSTEVKSDMEMENPMDRLVCGDVGFGKTEIAIRAAFKAVSDGKQVGLLVPTTILAEQHFNTFKDRLSQFPVKVAVLSRFAKKSAQTETLKEMEAGRVDIVIGTHRLLSKDIKFKDLGLLIIDEEHRFGVMAKEKLRAIRTNVDTLTLTATPIPRTLNLSLLGARDLSIISTPPPNRQPIYTKVETFDIIKVREWILKEISRNGQVYFVHDRVQSIEKIASYIKKHIPEVTILTAHGQMKPAELEKVIYDFMNKEAHVLLATKIIESGLDIPNVNTIIINRADRFGLAELHQLRGRVGRSNRQAYSYFLVPSINSINAKAVKRLQAIEENTELGGGFNLAMRDLEIRGAGNLLGTEQSGSIDTVGFDMYVKLLDEAVQELKQDEFKNVFDDLPKHLDRTEPTIDTYFEIGIPKTYMPDQSDRLSFYQALFSMIKIEELDEIKDEMIDKFGKIPKIIELLIQTAILRFYASFAQFERVVITRKKIVLILPKGTNEEFYNNKFAKLMDFIVKNYSGKINFVQTKDVMKLETENKTDSPEEVLEEINKVILEILNVYN
ncbi:MAG: transcription-repair coupling factor [Ignavibacteriae bacterium]|nr:transcription-repair coupling factor [Ignavibacteriota bacterium]